MGPRSSAPASSDDPRQRTAHELRMQARACAVMGSPLYAELLDWAAADVDAGGVVWDALAEHAVQQRGDGRGGALALRLMAAVHRLVISGHAPGLAVHYPSVGGVAGDGARDAFRATIAAHLGEVRRLVARPCQTNEVGRCAALSWGFFAIAAVTGLPLRLLEVGASAGLNLRWDCYRYGIGALGWGPADSPVDLRDLWAEPPPWIRDVEVVERRGCDLAPIDPAPTEPAPMDPDDGRATLLASVWADQPERMTRLRGALAVAARVPVELDRASVDEWLRDRLADPSAGAATVVFQSVVDEYLEDTVRTRFHDTLRDAAARAGRRAPLAWLRLEPVSRLRNHGLTLTTWPGGERRLLAFCGAHGQDVRAP